MLLNYYVDFSKLMIGQSHMAALGSEISNQFLKEINNLKTYFNY